MSRVVYPLYRGVYRSYCKFTFFSFSFSVQGCCICRAKSSSSRFTDSKRYEQYFKVSKHRSSYVLKSSYVGSCFLPFLPHPLVRRSGLFPHPGTTSVIGNLQRLRSFDEAFSEASSGIDQGLAPRRRRPGGQLIENRR